MAFDTSHIFTVGEIVDAALMNQQRDNLRYLKGIDVGQVEVEIETALSQLNGDPIRTNEDGLLKVQKKYDVLGSFWEWVNQVNSITDGQKLEANFYVAEDDGATEERLGVIRAKRVSEDNASIEIAPLNSGAEQSNSVFIKENGFVGLGTNNPGYELDVNGTLNAVDYVGLAILWSRVSGSLIEHIGNVSVGGAFKSTDAVNPGLAVSSTTECINLNAEKLQGSSWPRGSENNDFGQIVDDSDTNVAMFTLNKTGKWLIFATLDFDVFQAGNVGLDFEIRITDGTSENTGQKSSIGTLEQYHSIMTSWVYDSALGTETIYLRTIYNVPAPIVFPSPAPSGFFRWRATLKWLGT